MYKRCCTLSMSAVERPPDDDFGKDTGLSLSRSTVGDSTSRGSTKCLRQSQE